MKDQGMIDYARSYFPKSATLQKAIDDDKFIDVQYGFFIGGDPRDFKPDKECCSVEEIERWKKAVDEWDSDLKVEYPGSHVTILDENGNVRGWGTKATFGIGTYLYVWDEDPYEA